MLLLIEVYVAIGGVSYLWKTYGGNTTANVTLAAAAKA
jgi:hypothetical protein